MLKNKLCVLLGVILVGCTPSEEISIQKITIGVVSYGEGIKLIDRYEPLQNYLATQTNTIVELEPAYNEIQALEQIQRHNWSLVFAPPGLSAIALSQESYFALFPVTKINKPEKSVFVVLKNSPLQKLSDLSEQVIALGKPGSAAGYYLPLYDLYGLTLQEIKSAPTPKQVLQLVQEGKVVAGALSETEFKRYQAEFSAQFRILHQSRPIPSGLVILAPNVAQNEQANIIKAMNNAPEKMIQDLGYIPNAAIPDYQEFIKLVTKVKPLEKKIRQTPVVLTTE